MKVVGTIFSYTLALGLLAVSGYVFYTKAAPYLAPPCSKPVQYSIGFIDPRYGISTSTLAAQLRKAAASWNLAAGKTVVEFSETGDVPVSLVYTPVQQATVLGKTITADQAAYNAAKASLLNLKQQFESQKSAYEAKANAFANESAAYESQVSRWNAQGGAPPEVYANLQAQKRALSAEQKSLNAEAQALNTVVGQINTAVAGLNAAAQKINSKVNTYNSTAGTDFEQGDYVSDSKGKRINIFEYTNTGDLARVLEHELGHSIGLDHVDNPSSIMYPMNIGSDLTLSAEDLAELTSVCKLK